MTPNNRLPMAASSNNKEPKNGFGEAVAASACGCVLLPTLFAIAGLVGLQELKKYAQESTEKDANTPRTTLTATITKEATIPTNLLLAARREYPYWVMVETQEGMLKLNFDTDNPFYEYGKEERRGLQIYIRGKAGEDYQNKALDLDAMLDAGDTIQFKTREQTGIEREIYEIVKVDKKK